MRGCLRCAGGSWRSLPWRARRRRWCPRPRRALNAMTARMSHAALALNLPEGRWARAEPLRSGYRVVKGGVRTLVKSGPTLGGLVRQAALERTSPIRASSGNTTRHHLNRGGDRRLNWAIHTIALERMTHDHDTLAHIARRVAEGKTKREAMRCLKRCLTRSLHRTHENWLSPATAA